MLYRLDALRKSRPYPARYRERFCPVVSLPTQGLGAGTTITIA